MSEIIIKIEAPDLARALMALAEAIGWHNATTLAGLNNAGAQPTTTIISLDTTNLKPKAPAVTAPEPPPEQPQPELEPPVNSPAAVSAAQLQQKAADLIRKGKRELVVGIIKKHGAGKISEVAEDKRSACLAELEALEGA